MATVAGHLRARWASRSSSTTCRQGPKPDVEGVDQILLMTTDLDPAAATLPVQRVLRFPEMVASKIRLELSVLLERDSLGTKALGEETFYDLDVVGEIVKDGKLVDNFRYRFDFPASTVDGTVPPAQHRARSSIRASTA